MKSGALQHRRWKGSGQDRNSRGGPTEERMEFYLIYHFLFFSDVTCTNDFLVY